VPADLVARLERPLPAALEEGTATAVFCYGHCFHPREDVVRLEIVVDGVRHAPAATRMRRPDVARVIAAAADELLGAAADESVAVAEGDLVALRRRALRSGFWGTVPLVARAGRPAIELALAVRLANGAELVAPLGRVPVVPRQPAPALDEPAPPGLIAVCMATFEPDAALFAAQVESLRSQTDRDWVCVISDDGSGPDHLATIEAILGDDARFRLTRAGQRAGPYRNFERALRLAPAEAELIALCDQDDRWAPDKLAVLRAALGSAQLVYSDQRLVDATGRVLRDTLWAGRRNNHTDLAALLVANSITGAAALFRRKVAELALPFPDSPGLPFHDHWLGLVALAAGEVAYVDRPLYDYVQHPRAFFGDVTHGEKRRRRARGRSRGAYFHGYLAREVQAQALLARCATGMTPAKRRALTRFLAAQRSPRALLWLAARVLRPLAGRTETLGSESELVRGLLWHRLADRLPLDARLPALESFDQRRLRRWRARV
jgi:glycosyltransferase involved in cell wall biosynthesis